MLLMKKINIDSSLFKNALSQYDHAIVLFLSCLLLFVEYFNWLNSFLWSPNTNSGFLLWFIVLCQGLAVATFQIHIVSRYDRRSQQLFFFWGGEGKGEGMNVGVTEVLWRSCHLCLLTEPRETDDRLRTVLDPLHPCRCWNLPTYSVPGVFAFFQPILIFKQLQWILLPFPVELTVVIFCYGYNAASVCTCLFF